MIRIITGDCRITLDALPDDSVDMCFTSPPYFGLRDYGCEGQIGLEQSPEAYVGELRGVFSQVRRVLKPQGTLWLNLGDSYAAQRGGHGDDDAHRGRSISVKTKEAQNKPAYRLQPVAHRNCEAFGLKHKDMIGIPWRVAFALQA